MIRGKATYDAAPVWLQTLAVNATSLRTYRQKYGRAFHAALARLAANERKPREQLLDEQQTALRQMLECARQHVPFYRELNRPADDIHAWPIIDKTTVAAAPERFLSDVFARPRLLSLHTSGTTGTPLTVWFSREYHQTEMAFRWRHKAWAGVPFLSRSAYVSGHPVVPARQVQPPFWRKDHVEQRLLCSSYHLAQRNLPAYAAALAEWQPEFVHGYPSSLAVLARAGMTCRPKAVFTASETLLEFQREAITTAFGAPVFNWYGNTELTCNIVACAAGRLHYRTDYGYLETDDAGRMIVTGLNNEAMPLIRYRVGDVVTLAAAATTCPCGCAFPVVERVEGRVEDYIRTPDGRLIGRLDHLFKDVQHVREAQLVQRRPEELIVRLVRAAGYEARDEETVRAEARQRLGDAVRLQFEYVEKIERTAGGKFRFIVSELS